MTLDTSLKTRYGYMDALYTTYIHFRYSAEHKMDLTFS